MKSAMEVVFKSVGYLIKACHLESLLAHPIRSMCTGIRIVMDVGHHGPPKDPK